MKFLTMPVLYGLLAIALIALIFGGVQSYRLKSEQAKGIACESDRSNFAATQTGNLLTIEGLRHDAQVQAESRRIEREATAKALADADVTAAKFTEQYNRVSSELETLYARDAHASAWGNGGVDAGVADKLPGGKR